MQDFRANDYTPTNENIYKYHYGTEKFLVSVQTLSNNYLNQAYIHSHEEYQFMSPITDLPGVREGENCFFAKPNNIYFFPSKHPHGLAYDIHGIAYTRLVVDKKFFEQVVATMPDISLSQLQHFTSFETTEEIKSLVRLYKMEMRRLERKSSQMVDSLAYITVATLIRACVKTKKELQINYNRFLKIEEVCRYITANCDQPLTIDMISSRFALSKFHFIRMFAQAKGQTPIEFLTMARIAKARHMLEYGEESITEIANHCGFSTLEYFSRTFRKQEGVSPKQYRKYHQNQRTSVKVSNIL